MADNPVYRNYLDSYLGGQGNGLPVYRAGGSDAGKPLWKNTWKPVLSWRGTPGGTFLYPYRNADGDIVPQPIDGFLDVNGNVFSWGTSWTGVYYPPSGGLVTEYRFSSANWGQRYGTGLADGNAPMYSNNIEAFTNSSGSQGVPLPFSLEYTEGRHQRVIDLTPWLCVVYPWWGQNAATGTISANSRSPTSSTYAISQGALGLPQGVWGLLLGWGSNGIHAFTALYVSRVQHKVGWPWMQGRESLVFGFDSLVHKPDSSTVDSGYASWISFMESFFNSFTWELSAVPA